MPGMIIGAIMGLCFFTVPFWCYRRGLKDGLALNDNRPIEPIKTPLAAIHEAKEAKEIKIENDKIQQGIQNILNFDGTPQKEDKNE